MNNRRHSGAPVPRSSVDRRRWPTTMLTRPSTREMPSTRAPYHDDHALMCHGAHGTGPDIYHQSPSEARPHADPDAEPRQALTEKAPPRYGVWNEKERLRDRRGSIGFGRDERTAGRKPFSHLFRTQPERRRDVPR